MKKSLLLTVLIGLSLTSVAKADIDLVLDGWINVGGVPSAQTGRVDFNAYDALVDSDSSEALKQSPEYQAHKLHGAQDLSSVIQFAASCPDMGQLEAPGVYSCGGQVQLHRFQSMMQMMTREDLPAGLRVERQFGSSGISENYVSLGGHPTLEALGIERLSCQKRARLMNANKVVCTVVMINR